MHYDVVLKHKVYISDPIGQYIWPNKIPNMYMHTCLAAEIADFVQRLLVYTCLIMPDVHRFNQASSSIHKAHNQRSRA